VRWPATAVRDGEVIAAESVVVISCNESHPRGGHAIAARESGINLDVLDECTEFLPEACWTSRRSHWRVMNTARPMTAETGLLRHWKNQGKLLASTGPSRLPTVYATAMRRSLDPDAALRVTGSYPPRPARWRTCHRARAHPEKTEGIAEEAIVFLSSRRGRQASYGWRTALLELLEFRPTSSPTRVRRLRARGRDDQTSARGVPLSHVLCLG